MFEGTSFENDITLIWCMVYTYVLFNPLVYTFLEVILPLSE